MLSHLHDTSILWQMSVAERAAVCYLRSLLRPTSLAVEIGSYYGGCTRQLAPYVATLYSLDTDHTLIDRDAYPNVTWVTGDSADTVPPLLAALAGHDLGLILIDANHQYEAVLTDITQVLAYRPVVNTFLLLHDSWYADVRQAIHDAPWADNPCVQWVETDFVPGDLHDTTLVGGLALAYLTASPRTGPVVLRQAQAALYATLQHRLASLRPLRSAAR